MSSAPDEFEPTVARTPTGRAALAWLAGAVFVLIAAGAARPQRADDSSAAALEWLASSAAAKLGASAPSDADLAGAALAVRALSANGARPAEVLFDRFNALQRPDGSIGSSGVARPLTWLVLGALTTSERPADRRSAERARAWLSSAAPAMSAQSSAPTSAPPAASIGRALDFLRTTRAERTQGELDPTTLSLYTLAGGPFDVRAAYADAIDAASAASEPVTPAASLVASDLHALALSVAVLDHYRTSEGSALLAEAARPSAAIERELDAHRDARSGLWTRDGKPDLASTACALLVEDTLRRWEADLRARSISGPAGDTRGRVTEMGDCEQCHATLQPSQVAQWRASAHAKANVGCAACHGTNHSKIFRESGGVPPAVCAQCHPEAVAQFEHSKHARAEETLHRSALFAATPTAARAACESCHRIGARQSDGKTGSCNYCHPGHAFDSTHAREPQACTTCHTGNDYPQDMAFHLSKHGALYEQTRDANVAPSCASCHQPGGRHDDGFGLTLGSSGNGAVLAGTPTAFEVDQLAPEEFARRRAEMVAVCTQCHSSRLAEQSLREADELKREGDAQLVEAARILRELEAEGYFGEGAPLAFGPAHARPDPSRQGGAALQRFYEMWRFDHASAWKGAYHQSASVANRASAAGTLEALEFLRGEAARWRARGDKR